MDIRNERDLKAETMAEALMLLAGGQESELITRAKLIELGTDNMKAMTRALMESFGSDDNTTILGKLERYAKQISKGESVHNKDDEAELKNLYTEDLLIEMFTPEMLADGILKLAGIQGRGGLMNDALRAQYPYMNKAALVEFGQKNLLKMLKTYAEGEVNTVDNRTPIAKLDRIMRKMGGQDEGKLAGIKL